MTIKELLDVIPYNPTESLIFVVDTYEFTIDELYLEPLLVEQDIIKHHMFPLTPCPPKTKEGWIVSISDKLCSTYETLKLNELHLTHRRAVVARSQKLLKQLKNR